MLIRVRHSHQSGPISYVVKYDAEVDVAPHELRVAPRRPMPSGGVPKVLHPRRAGAIMRLRGLCIHDVDFSPRQFERHTAEDLSQALEADA